MNRTSTLSVFKNVSHVIFDLDGLLLNTETIYKQAIIDITKKYGKTYTPEVRAKVLGTKDIDSSKIIVREMRLPVTPEEFLNSFRQFSGLHLHLASAMPGAERLVCHLHKHKVPIAVATSSSRQSVNLKTVRHLKLFSLFDHIVSAGSDPEVKEGKPSPDVFLVCAARFSDKPLPDKCLVFEDAPNGIEAAVRAGMQCVMVPDPDIPNEFRQKATMAINSLEEFRPEMFGLPPFQQ